MGLNRLRRGYAIKEAASGVHFQDVGSYRARPVSIFKLPSYHHHPFHHVISIINFNPITHECQKHSTSTGTIALSIAYGPNILVIRDDQGMALSSPTSCI